MARFELLGERMIDQPVPRLVLIVLESSVEEDLKRGCLFHLLMGQPWLRKRSGLQRGDKRRIVRGGGKGLSE